MLSLPKTTDQDPAHLSAHEGLDPWALRHAEWRPEPATTEHRRGPQGKGPDGPVCVPPVFPSYLPSALSSQAVSVLEEPHLAAHGPRGSSDQLSGPCAFMFMVEGGSSAFPTSIS